MSAGVTSERRDVIVIGGGQAGLAMGYELKQQGRRFTILEAASEPAAAWRARWESLKLFTPVRYDSLPGRPFPGDPDSHPSRDDVVAYLGDYARELELPVELESAARGVRSTGGRFVVETDGRAYEADQIVVASGPFQIPRVPPIAERLDPSVTQLHSGAYRSPQDVAGGPVLVVGGGNTGFQIAEELALSHDVHLSVGSRQPPLPQRLLGRDVFWYLEATGLMSKTVTSRIGRRMRDRDTLIGSNPRRARAAGVHVRPRTTGVSGAKVEFADGTQLTPSAVIWATGFAMDHSWIKLPVFDGDGRPDHERGVTAVPGLYFLGLPWQYTRGSALLGWVKDDAAYIAARIAERAAGSAAGAMAPAVAR
jgi:putative flavoprotein involved in K+ transport